MNVVWGTNKTEILDGADGATGGADLILGLDGNDDLYGLGGDDLLKGGGGADDLYGGAGFDTADYSDSAVGVRIDLSYGDAKYGSAEGDTLFSIENLTGSQHDDMLLGDNGANTFIHRFGRL
jgi:Ca2+-binding RTX toxin-like protein